MDSSVPVDYNSCLFSFFWCSIFTICPVKGFFIQGFFFLFFNTQYVTLMMSTFFRSLCSFYPQWAVLLSVKAKMFQAHLVLSCPKIWCQLPFKATKNEMAGWHHWLDGPESGWTPGVGDGQGGLACCNSWGRKESDTTERLNWTELNPPRSPGSF